MTMGEIGCFLSHHRIWTDMLTRGYRQVMILEDDVHFESWFDTVIAGALADIEEAPLDWDLIYLGRKVQRAIQDEWFVPGQRYLTNVTYSYWTIGYVLSASGAEKLIAARPLQKIMALDEFLPIMYDQHDNEVSF